MKQSIASVAVLSCALCLGAAAQTAAPAASAKIAVIGFQNAVTATNEFQRDFADLQKKYQPKRQQLKSLSDQVDALKKQLQNQATTLSEDERESRARVIDDKEKELQRDANDDQSDFNQDIRDTFNSVATKVGQVLIAYAKSHGFTVVLDGTEAQNQSPLVLYAAPTTDITKAIVEAYNVKSGIPAPPVTATTPSAPTPKTGAGTTGTTPNAPTPQ